MSEVIRIGDTPLSESMWNQKPDTFTVLRGENVLDINRFGSDPSGSIWNIELKENNRSFHLAIFSLGDIVSEWQIQGVPHIDTLPDQETINTLCEVVKHVKSTEDFMDL